MKILNVLPSSGKSKGKPATKNFLGFEKVNLEVILSYRDVKHRITEGSVIGRTTIDKLNSSDAQMAEIVYIVPKGMIQS